MSILKSKHSGWTWNLKRTPYGGGGGIPIISDIVDTVDDALVGLDKTVGEAIPGGWTTVGSAALAAATMGGSLAASGALTAAEVAAADGVALSTYGMSAAEAMSAGISAEALGLPAAATAAQIGAVAGTASAEFAASEIGQQALQWTVPALESGAGATPFQLADGTMGTIQGGNILNSAGEVVAQGGGGSTLGTMLGYAKTAAPIVSGIGKLMGGYQAVQAGKQVNPNQADPFSPYRPQYGAQLQALMNNPNTVTETPGYQFNLAQGLQAQQAKQAAQGRLVSGGALLEANAFGQNLASQTYNDQLKTLMSLSGATQSPGTGATAMQSTAFGNVGSTALGYNALGAGASQVLNPLGTLYSLYNSSSPNPTA